jgi:hypothetical protein
MIDLIYSIAKNEYLLVAGYLLRPISKRPLSAVQQDELRSLFLQHIGPKGAQGKTPL